MVVEALEQRWLLTGSTDAPLIEGVAFVDLDGDGQFTVGEELEGVSIALYEDTNGNGVFDLGTGDTAVGAAILTDAQGEYCFDNLDGTGSFFVYQQAQSIQGFSLEETVSNLIRPGSADLVIDDFDSLDNVPHVATANPTTTSSATTRLATNVIGGERDLFAQWISGTGDVEVRVDEFDSNVLQFSTDSGVSGVIEATWDGIDANAGDLGGVDLTNGGTNLGFGLQIGADPASSSNVEVRLTQGGTQFDVSVPIPITDGTAIDYLYIPFTDFGFTPDAVDEITVAIVGSSPSIDGEISFIGVIAPKVANFLNDAGTDLAVTKTTTSTQPFVPGEQITYEILVENLGPNIATGASIVDTFDDTRLDADVSFSSVAANGATGNTETGGVGDINDTVDIPVGGTITYTVTADILPNATGDLINTATVSLANGLVDPVVGNNASSVTDTLSPNADLQITKDDGVTALTDGGDVTYTITVQNNGPSNVVGATIADTFPTEIQNGVITSSIVGDATITNSTSSAVGLNEVVNMAVGSTITYLVTGDVNANGATSITNTAQVSVPAGTTDPVAGNNSDDDVDSVDRFDLIISKTDNRVEVTPGDSIDYVIVVTNDSNQTVTDLVIADFFPAELTNVSYTTTATGTVTGQPATGNGDINHTVTMEAGSVLQYDVAATVVSSCNGNTYQHRQCHRSQRFDRTRFDQQRCDRHRHADSIVRFGNQQNGQRSYGATRR